jgi:sporulation protein YhbH
MQTDLNRFKKIVKGKIQKDLRRFIANGDLIARKGEKQVRIPIPRIELPKFKFNTDKQKKVGQGDGPQKPGKGKGQGEKKPGGKPGQEAGEHELEVDVTLEELAQILGDELSLPKIEPKGDARLEATRYKYSGIIRTGPEALRHNKRTFKEALKRGLIEGSYDPDNPVIIPFKSDKRYRSFKPEYKPTTSAVILYMMDVSGSMGDEQKELVRLTSFWIDTWLRTQYKGLEQRYIIHDASAREVDEKHFYRTKESGGTLISSAYKLALDIIQKDYPQDSWNIYCFQFSDGDNWSGNDTNECIQLLKEKLFPVSNLFCYGQGDSRYGSGQFLRDLHKAFGSESEDLICSQIKERGNIMDAIKDFLGKGR